jgi:hypothetical protein
MLAKQLEMAPFSDLRTLAWVTCHSGNVNMIPPSCGHNLKSVTFESGSQHFKPLWRDNEFAGSIVLDGKCCAGQGVVLESQHEHSWTTLSPCPWDGVAPEGVWHTN